MNSSTLNNLKIGQKGKVIRISGNPAIKRRLLDMGIVPNVEVKVEKLAPLGDPIDILVKGYHLTLRKEEASSITVEVIEK
ncbi:ferrous iron transport protein A [Candidatus Aerophobetes bacterium]|nr:ferrous iron transport protein A [Candidatus Aerophobetes bacterium]